MTIAQLGLAVDSSQVAVATPALEKMAAASAQAEAAATRLGSAAHAEAAGTSAATAAARLHTVALQGEAAAARMVANDTRMLGFQINDIVVSLASGMNPAMVALQQGSQISQIGLRGLANVLAPMAPVLLAVAGAAAVVGVNLAAVTTEINRNQKVQVGWFDVLKAGFEVLGDSVREKTKPAFDWLGSVWDDIAPKFASNIEAIIKSFDLAFRNIKTEWHLLPAALGEAAIGAAQSVINAVIWMGRETIANLNGIIAHANGLLRSLNLPTMNSLGNPNKLLPDVKLDNPFAGSGADLQKQLAQNYLDVSKTDPLGAIGDRARADKLAAVADGADKAAKSLKAANDNFNVFDKMLADVAPLLHDANDPLTELQSNMDKLGALLAAGEISWQQYGEAVNKANLNAASGVLGAVGKITGALSQAFEGNKAIAVANAVINTAEGVTKALAQGGIFGFASAAAIGVAGAAQIASILSAQPGSASVASVNGGAAASAASAAAPPQQASSLNITIRGSGVLSVDDFAKQLAAGLADGQHPDLARQITVTRAA